MHRCDVAAAPREQTLRALSVVSPGQWGPTKPEAKNAAVDLLRTQESKGTHRGHEYAAELRQLQGKTGDLASCHKFETRENPANVYLLKHAEYRHPCLQKERPAGEAAPCGSETSQLSAPLKGRFVSVKEPSLRLGRQAFGLAVIAVL